MNTHRIRNSQGYKTFAKLCNNKTTIINHLSMIVIKVLLSIERVWPAATRDLTNTTILKAHQYELQSHYRNEEIFTFSFYFKRYRTLTLNTKLKVDKISAIEKGL